MILVRNQPPPRRSDAIPRLRIQGSEPSLTNSCRGLYLDRRIPSRYDHIVRRGFETFKRARVASLRKPDLNPLNLFHVRTA